MKQCNGEYDPALHADCAECSEDNCKFRKEAPSSLIIASFAFTILFMIFLILGLKELFDIARKLF